MVNFSKLLFVHTIRLPDLQVYLQLDFSQNQTEIDQLFFFCYIF